MAEVVKGWFVIGVTHATSGVTGKISAKETKLSRVYHSKPAALTALDLARKTEGKKYAEIHLKEEVGYDGIA